MKLMICPKAKECPYPDEGCSRRILHPKIVGCDDKCTRHDSCPACVEVKQ